MRGLEELFDPAIRIATGDPRSDWAGPRPGEEPALRGASPARRREFLSGRALARQAMQALGLPAAAIPAGPDRAPLWPEGMTGSISHCADLCVVAVARLADGFVSLGLDIEPDEALDPDLVPEICGPAERTWLASLPPERQGILARAIFSAKESAYKCQYPLSGRLLDFQAMHIEIDPAASRFAARFAVDAGPFPAGFSLRGRLAIADGYIATAAVLGHGDIAARPEWSAGRPS